MEVSLNGKGFSFNNKNALIAYILGALSTISGEIVTRILILLGIGQYDVYQLNSLVTTIDEPSVVMGMIINFIIGGSAAVLLYVLIGLTGKELTVAKSFMISLLLWFVFESAFTALFEGLLDVPRTISDHYVHLVGTSTYGITQGILFRWILHGKMAF
jgi:hypothetical protein